MVSPGMNAKKREQPRSSAEDRAGNSQHPSASHQHDADIAAARGEFEGIVPADWGTRSDQSPGPSATRPSRRTLRVLLRMRCFVNTINNLSSSLYGRLPVKGILQT